MHTQHYSINHQPVETLLNWIKSEEIAIPEIQRPFVWNAAKVRDFIDSLYHGYPVGYLITWRNPDVRLKDGTQSTGKRILIDGQQRVMALLAALLGEQVVNKDYKETRIVIAFHPGKEHFQVANAAIKKDREWIADISTVLRSQREAPERIETLVRRWFVMSILTGRYTGSPETAFGVDIRNIDRQGVSQYLDTIERADLSDAFWEAGLPQQMDTSGNNSPYFNVFLASQVRENDKGFLSHALPVRELMEGQRDIHHVFPRHYLQKHGFQRSRYNQIANYVVMQREINIAIGARPPEKYFSELREQCRNGVTRYGGITDADQLQENLAAHCIPEGMDAASVEDYDSFLQKRRELMSAKIRVLQDSVEKAT